MVRGAGHPGVHRAARPVDGDPAVLQEEVTEVCLAECEHAITDRRADRLAARQVDHGAARRVDLLEVPRVDHRAVTPRTVHRVAAAAEALVATWDR